MMMLTAKDAVSKKSGTVDRIGLEYTHVTYSEPSAGDDKRAPLSFPSDSSCRETWQDSHAGKFLRDGCVCEVHTGYERSIAEQPCDQEDERRSTARGQPQQPQDLRDRAPDGASHLINVRRRKAGVSRWRVDLVVCLTLDSRENQPVNREARSSAERPIAPQLYTRRRCQQKTARGRLYTGF